MYYNNGYGYSQGGQQPQNNFENTFAWVYSDAGAEAFPVAPGKTVLLMHYNEPVLYVKSTDMNGRPLPMETYDLVRRSSSQAPNGYYSQAPNGYYSQAPQLPQQPNMNEYVKKSELEGQVNEIMNRNMQANSMGNGTNGNMQPNSRGNMPTNQGWGQEVQ